MLPLTHIQWAACRGIGSVLAAFCSSITVANTGIATVFWAITTDLNIQGLGESSIMRQAKGKSTYPLVIRIATARAVIARTGLVAIIRLGSSQACKAQPKAEGKDKHGEDAAASRCA